MRAVAYCRVSTKKDDQLNSLETQKTFFEEFAKKQNHELIKVYADEGITGTQKKNRKQFLQLMKDANKGIFDIVCVKDVSRLARNTVDFLQSIRELKALDIETLFVTTNMTILGNSEFVPTLLAAMAQEESANTSKRIKFGKNRNAENGRVPNLVYGYDKTNGDYFNLSINDFESEVVKRIFNMYIEQGYGANKIANILNNEGIKTKRGAKFSQNAIIRLLTNEIYTGRIINRKQEVKDFLTGIRKNNDEKDWIIVNKPELRIISDCDFDKANQTLKERNDTFKTKKERHSNTYPFSTLIKCEHCGYSFRRNQYTYVNTFTKWVCAGRNSNGTTFCPNKTVIDEAELLGEIKNYLSNILKNRIGMSDAIVKEFQRAYKSKEGAELDAQQITVEINKLKTKKSRELEMFSNGIIDMKELKERTDPLIKRISGLENDLALAEKNLSKSDALAGHIKTLFSTIEQTLSSDILTNAILKKVIDKITVNADGNINICLKPLGDMGLEDTFSFNDIDT